MKSLWRFCAVVLTATVIATNAVPFVALAQTASSTASTTQKYPPPSCILNLNTTVIPPGGSVTLTWESQNATGGSITGVGPVGPSGSINLLPSIQQQSTTFIGTFTGLGGTAQCSATVQISYGVQGVDGGTAGGGAVSGGTAGYSGSETNGGQSTATLGTPITGGSSATLGTPITGEGGLQAQYATYQSQTAPAPTPAVTGSAPAIQSPNGGLVPCGINTTPGDYQTATNCQACNLVQLIQNLINFAIGIAIPIAAALFAYAGVLYFTSASKPDNIGKAKRVFKDAFLGFLIAATAWLVVDTLLHVLFAGSATITGNWFTIQCTNDSARQRNSGITGWLQATLPGVNTAPLPLATNQSGINFSNGQVISNNGFYCADTGLCYSSANGQQLNGGDSGVTCDAYLGACFNPDGTAVTMPGASGGNIAAAAQAYYGANTSAGPDGGNLACAWAVNNILQNSGIAPIDGNSVSAMQQQLDAGRGTLDATPQLGDIVIFGGGLSHVGIVTSFDNSGQPIVSSNSSSRATFTNVGAPPAGSTYYRVNQ